LLSEFSFRHLVANNCHVGETTKNREWFEKNRFFVTGYLKKNYILDLSLSLVSLRTALELVENVSSNRLTIILSGQHPLLSGRVKSECDVFLPYGLYHVHRRWVGGIVSNFKYLALYVLPFLFKRTSMIRFPYHSKYRKRWLKLLNLLSGLRNALISPSFTFGSSMRFNPWIVRESWSTGTAHASLINTGSKSTSLVTYPIAANDSSVESMILFLILFKNSFFLGLLKRRRLFVFY